MCQKPIENRLNSTFICYNCDAKDFRIFDILNKIFQFVLLKE